MRARYASCIIHLYTGKGNIFVVGGRTAQQWGLKTVTEFKVKERQWRKRAPLTVRRESHAAAVIKLGGQKTLLGVFGGEFEEEDNWTKLCSCEVYDVTRDR
ncbi:unnamed protein product [Dibothriocephalus latus]|uniref:Uncharacterized protein n=1 Tax=Dibothriocephalus latus TaxID=60516 RepID=A0A3P7LRE1_DIBLA|nr:unnamed protein product [Dibothriocephalus latus]